MVRAGQWKGDAATNRADEDDAAAGGANQRQHRLGHRDLTGQIDLDLTAEVLDRDRLQRAGNRNAGVVDQTVETGIAQLGTEQLGSRRNRLAIGDVEHHRGQSLRARRSQRLGVVLLANPGEDPPAVRVEPQGGGPADPGRGSRH